MTTTAASAPALAPAALETAAAGLAPRQERARAVAEEFEAFFLAQVLQQMFEGIESDGPFGGGHTETMFRSMLNQQYAQTIARSGGIGIADAVYREILKLQELETS